MLFSLFQNGSPSSSDIDKLGFYLLVSLFFVVATIVEFAIALLVKRNSRCTGSIVPKVSANAIREKAMPQEPKNDKISVNKKQTCKENSLHSICSSKEMLHVDNSWFNVTERHVYRQHGIVDFEGKLTDSKCFILSPNAIDIFASVLFPTTYIIFNAVYWYVVL